ncbi:DUF2795 domain-containing protein [Candidatus Uhrbacteria bacterium]|nr:DUF2795 domain-containing protein [Candidatus Uhrbacteria bacterium]
MPQEQKKSNVEEVQNYLRGASYPAPKDELIKKARDEGAPENVIAMLEELPDQEYETSQDVMQQYGEIE